jgi:hypothetical protein
MLLRERQSKDYSLTQLGQKLILNLKFFMRSRKEKQVLIPKEQKKNC